jgi:hypothetical protein
MKEAQINVHLDKDEDNKPPTSGTQVSNTALATFIDINKDFTQAHAIQTISEIKVSILKPQQSSTIYHQTNNHRLCGLTSARLDPASMKSTT